MATRAIVTSQPVIACDVCGRRLLRGETPDVFVAGGQRRTVCELCVPRAAAEGWLRESEEHELSVRPPRPRRAGSLLGRLRQLREPQERSSRRPAGPPRRRVAVEEDGLYDFMDAGAVERPRADGQAVFIGSVQADRKAPASEQPPAQGEAADALAPQPEPMSGDPALERALKVFNEGETPLRVAGVSRSLGAPAVVVRQGADLRVAIVVAWELCWYRYEVDLEDELAGARLLAEGMELEELPPEDLAVNAAADERGELALTAV